MAQLSFMLAKPKEKIDTATQSLIDKLNKHGYKFIQFLHHGNYRVWVIEGPDTIQHLIGDSEVSKYLTEPPIIVASNLCKNI